MMENFREICEYFYHHVPKEPNSNVCDQFVEDWELSLQRAFHYRIEKDDASYSYMISGLRWRNLELGDEGVDSKTIR